MKNMIFATAIAILLAIPVQAQADVTTYVDERVQRLVALELQSMLDQLEDITNKVRSGDVQLTLETIDQIDTASKMLSVIADSVAIE